MPSAQIHFHGNLSDFLTARRRCRGSTVHWSDRRSVKDAIESLGVPHVEVDSIMVGGTAVDFSYRLQDGDRVEVYPAPGPGRRLSPEAQAEPRFVLDCHLGRLARYLRMLGFDSRLPDDCSDEQLVQLSVRQDRTLLTRDRDLLKRKQLQRGYYVRATRPRLQLQEIATRFRLAHSMQPFSRCMECNASLRPAAKQEIDHRLQPRTRRSFDDFLQCSACGRVYWRGSHFDRMQALVDSLK
ncbi:Mut7-C RNAse domain-containing protein [Microbulbifer yueqingensis]|uniref:Twitching motility protein PilT n=1 Tax=Microbulbifer yueqingensis TaxID=658219 RepID=A0A1G9E231_9GAMM|nr:Mut7-C RNAse domain-containing protein [Microbulbifer yueqingensis]SDK70195.1 hypothetical protein SAMN05216212_2989 [Microbulbifer yueqingensis]